MGEPRLASELTSRLKACGPGNSTQGLWGPNHPGCLARDMVNWGCNALGHFTLFSLYSFFLLLFMAIVLFFLRSELMCAIWIMVFDISHYRYYSSFACTILNLYRVTIFKDWYKSPDELISLFLGPLQFYMLPVVTSKVYLCPRLLNFFSFFFRLLVL